MAIGLTRIFATRAKKVNGNIETPEPNVSFYRDINNLINSNIRMENTRYVARERERDKTKNNHPNDHQNMIGNICAHTFSQSFRSSTNLYMMYDFQMQTFHGIACHCVSLRVLRRNTSMRWCAVSNAKVIKRITHCVNVQLITAIRKQQSSGSVAFSDRLPHFCSYCLLCN